MIENHVVLLKLYEVICPFDQPLGLQICERSVQDLLRQPQFAGHFLSML